MGGTCSECGGRGYFLYLFSSPECDRCSQAEPRDQAELPLILNYIRGDFSRYHKGYDEVLGILADTLQDDELLERGEIVDYIQDWASNETLHTAEILHALAEDIENEMHCA